jgi:hypothetical protein
MGLRLTEEQDINPSSLRAGNLIHTCQAAKPLQTTRWDAGPGSGSPDSKSKTPEVVFSES